MRDEKVIFEFIRSLSRATTSIEVDNILREAAKGSAPSPTTPVKSAYGVIWFDNSIPRARVWLYNIEADRLFRDLLLDRYLLEGAALTGNIDADLEFRSGQPASATGQIRLHNATMMWEEAELALDGITGYIPYSRIIGTPQGFEFNTPVITKKIAIKTLLWADRPLASHLTANSSYHNRILTFSDIELGAMGGKAVGTVISDHRGEAWRVAAMIKFEDVQLGELKQLLPGLPILARQITVGELRGRIGLVYASPAQLSISGHVISDKPGVIEISPRLHERIGKQNLETPFIEFQKLELDLVPTEDGQIEAKLDLYRRTAQSIFEISKGVPFRPHVYTIKFPLLPFVSELSQNR